MYSVTRRIKHISQPRGGYLNPKNFTMRQLEDGVTLNSSENISPSLVGLAVDYLSRLSFVHDKRDVFRVALRGAACINEADSALALLDKIEGNSDESITSACKLTRYDSVVRAGPNAYILEEKATPDQHTIENIRAMVNRSVSFFNAYGPIVKSGFTFEGGYTNIVSSGDGDFLTRDTIWDFKVSKNMFKSDSTLQLLMYFLLGKHSIHPEFKDIEFLGVFNPRKNIVHTLPVKSIDELTIMEVEQDVLGYVTTDTTETDGRKPDLLHWIKDGEKLSLDDLYLLFGPSGLSPNEVTSLVIEGGCPHFTEGAARFVDSGTFKAWCIKTLTCPSGPASFKLCVKELGPPPLDDCDKFEAWCETNLMSYWHFVRFMRAGLM